MYIFKWLGKALLGASAALLVSNMAFAAQEGDNSMPMNQLPQGGSEINQLRSTGFIPFSKTELKGILTESGFTLAGEQNSDDGSGTAYLTLTQGQPFVFVLQNCEGDSCMFLKMVHLINIAQVGLSFNNAEAAKLTQSLPFGYFAVDKPSDPLELHFGSPMLIECGRNCLVSRIGMFVANASATHRALKYLIDSRRNSASLEPKTLANNIARTYHYETLRVESGMRAAQLTGMDNFLGSMAMKANFAPAALDAIDLTAMATDHEIGNLGGFSNSAIAAMPVSRGPLTINEIVLPIEFKPLFPSE